VPAPSPTTTSAMARPRCLRRSTRWAPLIAGGPWPSGVGEGEHEVAGALLSGPAGSTSQRARGIALLQIGQREFRAVLPTLTGKLTFVEVISAHDKTRK